MTAANRIGHEDQTTYNIDAMRRLGKAVDGYYTLALPLGPNEEPKPDDLAAALVHNFANFPMIALRMKNAMISIEEDNETKQRALVARFKKWAGDPVL